MNLLYLELLASYIQRRLKIEKTSNIALELYARELEIIEKEKHEKISFKEKIEKWQLWFYRLTSDHHTDLAKIFNNVIMLIALFGILASALLYFAPTQEPSTMRFIQENGGTLSIFDAKTLPDSPNNAKIAPFIPWVLSPLFCGFFVGGYWLLIVWIEKLRKKESNQAKRTMQTIYFLSYASTLFFLFFKPPLLLPIIGKFFDESLRLNFTPLQSLCVVYYILMIFMLFSLQKTARKNSIIPS